MSRHKRGNYVPFAEVISAYENHIDDLNQEIEELSSDRESSPLVFDMGTKKKPIFRGPPPSNLETIFRLLEIFSRCYINSQENKKWEKW